MSFGLPGRVCPVAFSTTKVPLNPYILRSRRDRLLLRGPGGVAARRQVPPSCSRGFGVVRCGDGACFRSRRATLSTDIFRPEGAIFLFKHEKQLLRDVRVDRPNPTYAVLIQEQLGGPHGELKAAMQYIAQSYRIADPEIKDLFLDIAAEELGHMEMVGTLVNLFNGSEANAKAVETGPVVNQVVTGLAPALVNSAGVPWTAAYVNVTGDLPADLLSNIAAEQRAKVVYEYLYRQIEDKGARETIDFLLNREEAHNSLFRQALRKVQETGSQRDFGVDEQARLYFDLSTPGKYFDTGHPVHTKVEPPNQEQRQQQH